MNEEPTDVSIIQLTQKVRPADRFLASNVHELSHGRKAISFLSVVEIGDAWNPARELGLNIPQTFVRLFSNSEHQSILTKFEDALKGINKLLADQQLKITSPINCALALVAGDEVYLASVGEVSLTLLRNGRLSHLSADLKDGSSEFTTVTSGELTAADWLFVANQDLGHLLEDLPIADLNIATSNSNELEEFLRAQIGLENPRVLAGCCVRYSPDMGQLSALYLDELESRTPINLPKFTTPRFKLPAISLAGLKPIVARATTLAKKLSLRQWLLTGCALVIIIALAIGISRLGGDKKVSTTDAPTLLSQLTDLEPAEVRPFANSQVTASKVAALSQADQVLLQNMLTATSLGAVALPKEVATLPSPVFAIDSPDGVADELYLLDSSGQLWKWQNQVLTKLEQKQLISQPASLVAYSSTKILVSDQVGNVWYFDGTVNQPQSLTLPTKLATGTKLIQKYLKNLYLFNNTDNQIYRVANFDKDLSSAAVATKASLITNAPISDWSVNGDIWTINSVGTILGLRRNAPLTSLPTKPLNGPFHLAATDAMVLTVDGRIITSLDTITNNTSEKIILADQPITDIAPNKTNGWWVVIDSKLYALTTAQL